MAVHIEPSADEEDADERAYKRFFLMLMAVLFFGVILLALLLR